ncbi:hypothetical protein BC835DRAFT_1416357 [Cytidiella melzeri]|nr:hypothetical protein BC835DRAFT_1416357 [Cytidiella melzeri]
MRRRASKFFRLKSASTSDNDSVTTNVESLDQGSCKRSKSLPLGTPGSETQGEQIGGYASPGVMSDTETGVSFASSQARAQAFTTSVNVSPVISMPIPELAPTAPNTLTELSALANKAEEVIQADTVRSAEHAQLKQELEIFKGFDATLQFKSTAQNIFSNVKSGLGDDPWFMRALDDVARIHPFVSVAVIAFKACYNMEMARRHNDKRVISLFKEMKDMIEVLTRLKDITDPEIIGPNGSIIKGKLQTLVDSATQDMKDCGNACDAWMKKQVLVKVLVGPAWESKLAGYTAAFTSRRMEFDFALQIHTATAVEAIQSVTRAMDEKLAYMSQQFALAFRQMRPPEEVQLAEIVIARGGIQAVQTNEATLRELFKAESPANRGKGNAVGPTEDNSGKVLQNSDGSKVQRSSKRATQRSEYTFDDFKDELREDLDTALRSNFQAFEGKFKLFYDQLEINLHRYMREESDRVISEVNKGPHDLIRDPELRMIWQEMHWRRNVKARPFVMTLRDHFSEKAQNSAPVANPETSTIAEKSTDSWARQYVDVKYLQPIMDAIDDDGSGHVTITEVNRLTEQLPISLGWSLTLWLAYWAIGWQTFAAKYREEILQTYARMFAIRHKVLPENRNSADYYLRVTWPSTSMLAKSLRPPVTVLPDDAEERFKEYVQHEEDRLRKNLTGIKYDIDALETVYGVLGPGRIEKHVLTLLCLMLRRDLELFQMATTARLDSEELWDAADSMVWVHDAVQIRYGDLVAQFNQQRLDVSKQMKLISCEIFDYFHDSTGVEKMIKVLTSAEQETTDEELPSAQLKDMPPNNYPTHAECPYDCEGYIAEPDELKQDDLDASDVVKPFLGQWNGYIHNDQGLVERSMVSFFAHAAVDKPSQIEATSYTGEIPFTLSASVTLENGVSTIKATISYAKDLLDRHFTGVLQIDGSIVGSQGSFEDKSTHDNLFIWTRVPSDLMRLRPLPPYNVAGESEASMVPNKARAMFDYAIRAVMYQNRKASWSWTYFKERRDNRLRFLELCTNCQIDDNAYSSAPREMDNILRSFTNVDRRYYDSAWNYYWSLLPHHTASCDPCGATCEGCRYVCLDCVANATEEAHFAHTVDFCKLSCSDTTIHPNPSAVKLPHAPSHNLLKMLTFLHLRDMPLVYTQAKRAVEVMQRTLTLVSQNAVGHSDDSAEESDPRTTAPDFSKVSPPQNTTRPQCAVCRKDVTLPCWLCIQCLETDDSNPVYLCDSCEGQTLLKCLTCEKPFKQTRWFYGSDSRDTFQCATCIAKRVPAVPVGDHPHRYIHPLVRCHVKEEVAKILTVEENIAAVAQTVSALDQRMLRLEGYMERIERMLASVGPGNQQSLGEVIGA